MTFIQKLNKYFFGEETYEKVLLQKLYESELFNQELELDIDRLEQKYITLCNEKIFEKTLDHQNVENVYIFIIQKLVEHIEKGKPSKEYLKIKKELISYAKSKNVAQEKLLTIFKS